LLYSNYITNYAFLSNEYFDYDKIDKILEQFDEIKSRENYFSKHFGNKFFSNDVANKSELYERALKDYTKNKR